MTRIILFLVCFVSLRALAEGAQIRLFQNARVATERYIFSQISTCSGDEAICNVIRTLDVAASPQPGTIKNLSVNELKQVLQEEGLGVDSKAAPLEFVGSVVAVERISFVIDSEAIKQKIEEQVSEWIPSSAFQRWSVSLGLNSKSVNVTAEEWVAKVVGFEQFKSELLRSRTPFVRRVQIRITPLSGESSAVNVWGTIRFTPEFKLLSFVNGLDKGAIISEVDIAESWVGFAQFMDGAPRDRSLVLGKRMKVAARPSSIVRFGVFEEQPLVNRGDDVQIKLIDGSIEMESRGKSFQTGTLGQTVDVEMEGTKKKVRSKVVAQGRVEVSL